MKKRLLVGRSLFVDIGGTVVAVRVVSVKGSIVEFYFHQKRKLFKIDLSHPSFLNLDSVGFFDSSSGENSSVVSSGSGGKEFLLKSEDDTLFSLFSPVAGKVMQISVSEGALVRKGKLLAVVSSMKIEHEITAPFDLVVKSIRVFVGQVVREKDLLFLFLRSRDRT